MVFFNLCKLRLQMRMHSHPVGLDDWFLVGPFAYFHTSCVRSAMALARLCECAGSPEPSLVAYVISTIISWAGSYFNEARYIYAHFVSQAALINYKTPVSCIVFSETNCLSHISSQLSCGCQVSNAKDLTEWNTWHIWNWIFMISLKLFLHIFYLDLDILVKNALQRISFWNENH